MVLEEVAMQTKIQEEDGLVVILLVALVEIVVFMALKEEVAEQLSPANSILGTITLQLIARIGSTRTLLQILQCRVIFQIRIKLKERLT